MKSASAPPSSLSHVPCARYWLKSITATSRWPKRRGCCRSLRARSDHAPSTGYARCAALWRPTTRRPRSGGGLVLQRASQLVAARDAELFVGPLQVAFHGPDRQLHLGGDLLVGPARRGLHRRVELALSQPHPGGDEPDRGRGCPFAAGQQPRGPLLGGSRPASLSGVAQQDGGLGAGFRGVEDGAEILEVVGDLAENFAVPGGEGAGVGGAGGRQVAVDLS